MISVPNSVPAMAMMTQPMRLTPATASATRANDNGRECAPLTGGTTRSQESYVTSWAKAAIQMQFRAVDGSSIRFAPRQETTGPR
jgi:hypothetical protein